MSKSWSIQEANRRFSALVDCAIAEGPQHITKRGKGAVVVVSTEYYDRLTSRRESLVEFFGRSPLRDIDLDRAKDLPR